MQDAALVENLPVDPRIVAKIRQSGIERLHPPQAEALPFVLAGRNLVLAIPTASGKSLVAYIALVKAALEGRHGLYIVPLRALAAEKVEELRAFSDLGVKVRVATGELDESDAEIRDADIVVATSEKADSLMRHKSRWMESLGVVVADEVHLIHDQDRGPTIEVLIARLRMSNPKAQVIALSATIKNAQEIAQWLNAELVLSDFRPVQLREGVSEGTYILFADRKKRMLLTKGEPVEALALDSLKADGQCLVFVNTRRSAVAEADRLRDAIAKTLKPEEAQKLARVAESARTGERTDLHDRLARCITSGTAFHHAGLASHQRRVVEAAFKERLIKVLVATPTLAAGVNLPAKRVIVRDVRRFESNLGQVPIPVLEIKQMCGRAGRPRYDKEGEAILLARSDDEVEQLMEEYLYAEPEPIFSKLGTEPALRVHLLAAIATGFVNGEGDLDAFLASTFLAHQTNAWDLKPPVDAVLEFLDRHELIKRSGADLKATALGRRVSELYIDPLTAVRYIEALDLMGKRRITDRSFLHLISSTPDSSPLYMRESEWGWVQDLVEREADTFLVEDIESSKSDEGFLSEVKTAEVLAFWTDEMSLDTICTKFDIGPGDLRTRIDTARWLLYALREVAKAVDAGPLPDVVALTRRVVNGVKPDLLPLVSFRGVGRVRARALWAKGYRGPDDIRKASIADLARVAFVGPKVAESMKREAQGSKAEGRERYSPQQEEDDLPAAAAPAPTTAEKTTPGGQKGSTSKRRQKNLGDWKT
jgi:helicase